VERTAAAIAAALERTHPGLDWRLCYQSRVGPLKWLGPSTQEEIERAGREEVALVVAPIAFVSEHVETLVELDLDYRELAARAGVPEYRRVPAVGTHPEFIGALAALVRQALVAPAGAMLSEAGGRQCPAACGGCALAAGS
jgi:ferrochelatase